MEGGGFIGRSRDAVIAYKFLRPGAVGPFGGLRVPAPSGSGVAKLAPTPRAALRAHWIPIPTSADKNPNSDLGGAVPWARRAESPGRPAPAPFNRRPLSTPAA